MQQKRDEALSNIQKAFELNPTPQVKYAYNQIYNNLPLAIKKTN